jgi:hypothetical protein
VPRQPGLTYVSDKNEIAFFEAHETMTAGLPYPTRHPEVFVEIILNGRSEKKC